jgi:hypothetical protein
VNSIIMPQNACVPVFPLALCKNSSVAFAFSGVRFDTLKKILFLVGKKTVVLRLFV